MATVTFDAGTSGFTSFHTDDGAIKKLEKLETADITYKLEAGLIDGNWNIALNQRRITLNGEALNLNGSKLRFVPDDGFLKIVFYNTSTTKELWVDFLTNEASTTKINRVAINTFVSKVMAFQPTDYFPERVLANSKVVVIYGRNADWSGDAVYAADGNHSVTKCILISRVDKMRVKFPNETVIHTFDNDFANPKWDNEPLAEVKAKL